MANRYWVGGSGTWNSTNTTNWSTSSGGSGGASAPTVSDSVFFDANSFSTNYTVTCTDSAVCASITTTAPSAGVLTFNAALSGATYFFSVYTGNINIHSTAAFVGTNGLSVIYHENSGIGTISATFNGGGSSNIYYYYAHLTSGFNPTLNFCNSTTATFGGVLINCQAAALTRTTPNLASANIIIDSSSNAFTGGFSGGDFRIINATSVTLTSMTLRMGSVSATSLTDNQTVDVISSGTVSHSGMSIIEQRGVTGTRTYNLQQATNDYVLTTFTLLGNAADTQFASVTGVKTVTNLTATNVKGLITFQKYNTAETNFTLSSAATVTTSNIQILHTGTKSFSSTLTLASGGVVYTNGANTITGVFSATGASAFNGFINTDSAGALTITVGASLVNCHLVSPTITMAGGSGNNFAYSLSTPVSNIPPGAPVSLIPASVNITTAYGSTLDMTYPQIICDSFTLTNSGGTFSIEGGATNNYRAFVRPYNLATSNTTCTMSLAVNPTLTRVDFWRVTPAGAASVPWTGTSIGTVGTVANITRTAPKTVYWVGGTVSYDTAAAFATSSGGAGAVANYPLPQDTLIIDTNSGSGTWNIIYSSTIRLGSLVVTGVNGSMYFYGNKATVGGQGNYSMWVSGGIFCNPLGAGSAVIGQDASLSYISSTTNRSIQRLYLADSSSLDSRTIQANEFAQFFSYNAIYFANFGSVSVDSNISKTPIYEIDSVVNSTTGTVVFNCSQIGILTGEESYYSQISSSYGGFKLGRYGSSFDLGATSFYTHAASLFSKLANTAYTVNSAQVITINSSLTNVGRVAFFGWGAFYNWFLTVPSSTTVTFLSIGFTQLSFITTQAVAYFSGNGSTIQTYTMTVAPTVSARFYNQSGGAITLNKVGGGRISVGPTTITATGVPNYAINATPSSTWYTTGTIGAGNTGWNSGSPPAFSGAFAFF